MSKTTEQKLIKPVCPLCEQEMSIVAYRGYYDGFTYWQCGCEEKELYKRVEDEWYGSYA